MSGWTKVFLATGVMLLALAGLNLSIWRRLRAAREAARDDTAVPRDGG